MLQPHLLSIAENICEAEFNPKEYTRIDAVISMEGERIQVQTRSFAVFQFVSVFFYVEVIRCKLYILFYNSTNWYSYVSVFPSVYTRDD